MEHLRHPESHDGPFKSVQRSGPSRILSGVQSSGKQHLGNYYGAIRQFVQLQNEAEALYFIANLHALNSVRDPNVARELTLETAAAFMALGVDPAKSALFRQSDIPEVTELYWILGTVAPKADLELAHSYKDKLAQGASPLFGLFAYPVLMAADILLYDSDVVPVGKDQTQHLELTIDWAGKFNRQYSPGYDTHKRTGGVLKIPAARTVAETAVVPGTDGEKMSKTYNNTIDLFGTDEEVKTQIMKRIKTDSTPPEQAKTSQTLLDLLKLSMKPSDFSVVEEKWKHVGGTGETHGYGTFKKTLLDAFHAEFDAPRKRYAELMNDRAQLEKLLQAGAAKAREYASPVISRVRSAVGL